MNLDATTPYLLVGLNSINCAALHCVGSGGNPVVRYTDADQMGSHTVKLGIGWVIE